MFRSSVVVLFLSLFTFALFAQTPGDPGFRVIEQPGTAAYAATTFPPSNQPWDLHYQFIVPPLPHSPSWNFQREVFYLWGDVDFDLYGSQGPSVLSNYVFNQIVPQLMIGQTLGRSGPNFEPIGLDFQTWVIEAQYFWRQANGQDFAYAGQPYQVNPGDVVTTDIQYNPSMGAIRASISAKSGTSTIVIPRPFMNENPPLFQNWSQFFQAAEQKSQHPYAGQAIVNVESHDVDQTTICSILPFHITDMTGPNFPTSMAGFATRTQPNNSLVCPTQLVTLGQPQPAMLLRR